MTDLDELTFEEMTDLSNREYLRKKAVDEKAFEKQLELLEEADFTCDFCGRVGGEYGEAQVFPAPKDSLEEVPPIEEATISHFDIWCVQCSRQAKEELSDESVDSHPNNHSPGQSPPEMTEYQYDRTTLAGLAPVDELPEPDGDADHSVHHDQLEAWLPEWRDCWYSPMEKERAKKVLPYLQPKDRLDDPSSGHDYSRRVKRHRKYWRMLLRQNHREVPILGVIMDLLRYLIASTILLVAAIAAVFSVPQIVGGPETAGPAVAGWFFFVGIAYLIHPYRHELPLVGSVSMIRQKVGI